MNIILRNVQITELGLFWYQRQIALFLPLSSNVTLNIGYLFMTGDVNNFYFTSLNIYRQIWEKFVGIVGFVSSDFMNDSVYN